MAYQDEYLDVSLLEASSSATAWSIASCDDLIVPPPPEFADQDDRDSLLEYIIASQATQMGPDVSQMDDRDSLLEYIIDSQMNVEPYGGELASLESSSYDELLENIIASQKAIAVQEQPGLIFTTERFQGPLGQLREELQKYKGNFTNLITINYLFFSFNGWNSFTI